MSVEVVPRPDAALTWLRSERSVIEERVAELHDQLDRSASRVVYLTTECDKLEQELADFDAAIARLSS